MLIAAGTVLEGKYRVERLLGAGGMGTVWIAEHTGLHRPVAVKVLDSAATVRDATAVQRFMREAQTAARLRSDHIVDVLDVGKFDDGTPFLIMELLEGETLSSRIKQAGRLPQNEAANLVDQLLNGLSAAHDAGVIHRDIKPDNCFITQKAGRDHLKLLDFGISKVAGDAREMRMTRTGVVMGTPYYMAPEQARGAKEIDHRCDLYAVGAILYECITGRVPFEAESVNELLFKIVLEPLIPPRSMAPELDPAFEDVILRAMGREAETRYQTAGQFRDALTPYLSRSLSGGTQVVVLSSPPPRNTPPVSGNDATAPIDSDAVRAIARDSGSRHTPSGFQGLSKTGPLHLSEPPPARSTAMWIAVALLAVIAVGGGAMYLSSSRTPAAASAAPIAPPEPTLSDKPLRVVDKATIVAVPSESVVTQPSVKLAPPPPPSKGASKKVPSPSTQTATVNIPPPPPPNPTPTPTNTGKSPRPIDTAL